MNNVWRRVFSVFEVDLRSLAVARIGLALVLLGDLIVRAEDLGAHYSDGGVLPRSALWSLAWRPWRWSLHAWHGEAGWQVMLFALAALSAVALLLGWRTRWATVLCWLLTVSVQNRNPLLLTGGDTVLRLLLLWAVFMPWGARFSLDAARDRTDDQPAPREHLSAGAAGWMLQVFMVHVFAGLLKTGAEWRSDFSALNYTLQIDQLRLPAGDLLTALPAAALQAMTASVMVAELVVPVFLFVALAGGRVRLVAALVLAGFHLGLVFTLRLGIFPWVNLVSLVPFVPALVWRRWPRWEQGLDGLFYRLAAVLRRRPVDARHSAVGAISLDPRAFGGRLQAAGVGLLVGLALLWNVGTLKNVSWRVPEPLLPLVQVLRLDQQWRLFAPYPFKDDGWWVIPGQLADGRSVDLLRGGSAVDYAKPPELASEFPTYRWRKYLRNLWLKRHRAKRPYYAIYLCRQWNREHPAAERLDSLRMVYVLERSVAVGEPPSPPRPVELWQGPCPR